MQEEAIIHDELTAMITDRLGEMQRKKDRMREMESRSRRMSRRRTLMAAAVCAVALIAVAPLFQRERSPLDIITIESAEYRAAIPEAEEITLLIAKQDYAAALALTERELKKSDEALSELNYTAQQPGCEEMAYMEREEQAINSELRWIYIYLLLHTDQEKAAKKQLKRYMKHKEWCDNWEQALALNEALKEKNENFLKRWVTFYTSLL